jgi:hypothetical protein
MPIVPTERLAPVRKLEELKEMFTRRRGVSFEDFRKYYDSYREKAETHSEFRRIDEAIQFLEDNGGYSYPVPEDGKWLTEGQAWVAIEGYMPLHKYPPDWFADQVKFKYLVNVVGIHSRVLVMDDITARIWEHVASNPVAYEKAIHWTLLIRPLLGDHCTAGDIERTIRSQVDRGTDPAYDIQNGRLAQVQENCTAPSLRSVLDGEWVPAPRKLFWFDGYHHLLLMPRWVFNLRMDYSIDSWTYFL